MADKTFHSLTLPGTDPARVPDVAAEFNTGTNYAIRDYCTYQGVLYRCTTAHAAGAWNASHFQATNLDNEFDDKLKVPPYQSSAPANPRVGDLWIDDDEDSPILNIDPAPIAGSTNAVQSGGTRTLIDGVSVQKANRNLLTGDYSTSATYEVGQLVLYYPETFSTTHQYIVGESCIRSGKVYKCITAHLGAWNASHFQEQYTVSTDTLYRCITRIGIPEAWTPAHWQATNINTELNRLRESEADTDMIAENFGDSSSYAVGEYVVHNSDLFRCISAVNDTGSWDPDNWEQIALTDDIKNINHSLSNLFSSGYAEYTSGSYYSANFWRLSVSGSQMIAGKKYKIIIKATSAFELADIKIGTSGTGASMVDTIATNVSIIVGDNEFYYVPLQSELQFIRIVNNASNISAITVYQFYDVVKIGDIIVTPQMYGAFGDGIHDDTEALQLAINSGKRIFLPGGTYLITEPLVINKSGIIIEGVNVVSWEGDGSPATIYVSGFLTTIIQAVFQFGENANNIKISNLYINGNYKSKFGIYRDSNTPGYAYNISISNIRIRQCSVDGIHMESIYLSKFEMVRVSRCSGKGFYFSGKVTENSFIAGTTLTLIQCYADMCNYGIDIRYMVYSSLINCAADSIYITAYVIYRCGNLSFINCGSEGCYGAIIGMLAYNKAITIQGLNVIELKNIINENASDAVIYCGNTENLVISGYTESGSGEVTRAYKLLLSEPNNAKVFIKDASILAQHCSGLQDGNIVFSDNVIFTNTSEPDYYGQIKLYNSKMYIGVIENNILLWKEISLI